MQVNQIWEALQNERAIVLTDAYRGKIDFKKVTAVISRKDKNGNVVHTAELLDSNGVSIVIANPKNIKYKY